MTTRISPTLVMTAAAGKSHVCCRGCGHEIAQAGADTHWKDKVRLIVKPVSELTGWSTSVHPDLVLRQFVCPSCGHLLDSETALPEDPFLYDIVHG